MLLDADVTPYPEDGHDVAGLASAILAALGWVVIGVPLVDAGSTTHGEVAGGLAALGMMIMFGVALSLEVMALVLALVGRRNRRSKPSLIGLLLSSAFVLGGVAGMAFMVVFFNV